MVAINPYQTAIFGRYNSSIKYVVISNTKTTSSLKNDIRVRTKNVSESSRGSATPETKTKLTNKLKIEKTFSIVGHLAQGKFFYNATQQETETSAQNKYDLIVNLMQCGNTLSLIYRGYTYVGAIRHITIEESGTQIDSTEVPTGTAVYDITIDFIVGVDRLVST